MDTVEFESKDIAGLERVSTERSLRSIFNETRRRVLAVIGPKHTFLPSPAVDRFLEALRRVSDSSRYQAVSSKGVPYGIFGGRPVIGADSFVRGGISLSWLAEEAVVVDESFGALPVVLKRVLERFGDGSGDALKGNTCGLSVVFDAVNEALPYQPAEVQKLRKREQWGTDRKVALDSFVNERAGDARHRLLLLAYLLEGLRERGLIRGRFLFEAMAVTVDDDTLLYTTGSGRQFRIRGNSMNFLDAVKEIPTRIARMQQLDLTPPPAGELMN